MHNIGRALFSLKINMIQVVGGQHSPNQSTTMKVKTELTLRLVTQGLR